MVHPRFRGRRRQQETHEAAMRMILLVALVVASTIGVALIAARQQVYAGIARLSGTARDMGPIDFATLRRRSSPNDALACPPGHCTFATPDRATKVYDMPPAALSARLTQVALAEPRTRALPCPPSCELLRFVQYSRLMGFPDTIDVQILPSGNGQSTLAIYSRSLVGHGDFGVNRARIDRWLAALDNAA
jgi:uncharacterized protein (DUF1499 family)